MSFYRNMIAAIATLGLATAVFAADQTTTTTTTTGDNTTQATTQTTDAQTATDAKVDLNKATVKQLMQVKGLTAGKAKAIVAYRKKHGDFKSVDDLKEVKGFKKMNDEALKPIQDQLMVN